MMKNESLDNTKSVKKKLDKEDEAAKKKDRKRPGRLPRLTGKPQ